ncbi:MAG: hypothetical protein KAH22_02910 [Thiotrichaceae bacterium]|nr:hypothetical protein [Thiotrichaceae bacterium]
MKAISIGIRAETLSPFAYHSLMVQGGTATLPELISDNAIAFGLASSLGMMQARVALPSKDYLRDWHSMPWRSSVFMTKTPELLPPIIRRLNLTEDGGYKTKLQNLTKKGNFKDFFSTQEVPQGVVFQGALFGFDPFKATGLKEIIIRIGLHRNGMVRLTKQKQKSVRLNASTAVLFKRNLSVDRYLLHSLQLTAEIPLKEALEEVQQWQ